MSVRGMLCLLLLGSLLMMEAGGFCPEDCTCNDSVLTVHCIRTHLQVRTGRAWVSFETSFDSKQPKLVSALSKTKGLFRLFRFYTEIESFDVSIEPKQTEDQPKQFDREHILLFFTENFGFFGF
jgi:hypothetical protein